MKKISKYSVVLTLFLSQMSFGLRDYQLDRVLRAGLGNPNHLGLAYNPNTNHLFLGRGSSGNGYLTEIDLNGNIINDRQLGVGTYTSCYVRELSYDHSTDHLFAFIHIINNGISEERIWEMGTDLQTIYNDISLQEVMNNASFMGFAGLQVNEEGIWMTNYWTDRFIHFSRSFEVLSMKPTPAPLTTLSSSPDGGFLAIEYDIFVGEKYLYEFDGERNHLSTTPICSTYGLPTNYGMRNVETYRNKLFLSNNTEIYFLSSPIPEPTTAGLLALGTLLIRKRRK